MRLKFTGMLAALAACLLIFTAFYVPGKQDSPVPAPKREFRAIWIATAYNIDWPSRRGLSPEIQRQEYINILNRQQLNGMNAVVVQVRPAGDAIYPSPYDPWSEFISGAQGVPPSPYYDPLQFAIYETHQRGMEFHAWINPFRGISHVKFSSVSAGNIWHRHPEWFFQFGNTRYFNPGIPEVRHYVAKVVADIVRRYDIDGLHFDDYFYPYPTDGSTIQDQVAYSRYGKGFNNIQDWRRHNIDAFVREVSDSVRAIKPWVKLGISPWAIWREKRNDPEGADTWVGLASFDHLYADVRRWLREGWIDYVAPQCYYGMEHAPARYETLLSWWQENRHGRHLYIGQAMYKVKEGQYAVWRDPEQIPGQLHANRRYEGVSGSIFFSANAFASNPLNIESRLRNEFYRTPALPPPMLWKDKTPPRGPEVLSATVVGNSVRLVWDAPDCAADGEEAARYVVYRFAAGESIDFDDPSRIRAIAPRNTYVDEGLKTGFTYRYIITSLDRLHNESTEFASAELQYLPQSGR